MIKLVKILPLLAALAFLPGAAAAQEGSPWQWQLSLLIDTPGNAMYMPAAVAFDRESERYYAVDTGRNRLVSFNRQGELLRAFTADDRLQAPFDMVRLDDGRLWVVEKGRNSLTLIDIGARKVTPHTLHDGDRLVFPHRIALGEGKLHVLDRASGQILRLNADLGVEQRFRCRDCLGGISDFVISNGEIWALETRDRKIYRFADDGAISQTISLDQEASFPVSLALDGGGFVYVLDRQRNSILTYDENGRFRYRFLGPGHARGQLHFPRQLRFDPWGRLCVVDEGNGRVEIYSR
ncbi:hypothetical protein [Desulfurivibrio alkaliphilus]|nr:hypothetical protein [Desulfurivibrio alkaliphilus]